MYALFIVLTNKHSCFTNAKTSQFIVEKKNPLLICEGGENSVSGGKSLTKQYYSFV